MEEKLITLRSGCDVSLENYMASDDNVAMSAWVSFGNDDAYRLEDRNRVEKLINFLYGNGHHTPFESSVFTWRIKTPIFVARELFRHRSSSFNEWSGRYSEMVPEFYLPESSRPLVQQGKPGDYYFVEGSEEQYAKVITSQEKVFKAAWQSYQDVLDAGVAKEVARNVLPLATYTYFYVTMNARNSMHFLNLRNESHALAEIQEVAVKMEEAIAEHMPLTYKAYLQSRRDKENMQLLLKERKEQEKRDNPAININGVDVAQQSLFITGVNDGDQSFILNTGEAIIRSTP